MPTFIYIPAASSSAWTPSDLANLFFWFDADAITGKTDGNSLTELSDSSGNSRHLTGTGATYETNELNSKAVASLTADAYVSGTVNTSGSKIGCFQVVTRDDVSSNSHYISFGESSSGNPAFLFGSNSSKVPWFRLYNSSSTLLVDNTTGAALPTTATILGFRADVNAGTFQSRRNGSNIDNLTGLTPTSSTLNTGNAKISTDFGGSATQGDIAECLIIMGEVSDSDRDKIEGYLAHKWGLTSNLPTDHPYKNSAP